MDRYTKIRVLGKGSFGSAWLAESNPNGKKYALKELSVSTMSEHDRHFALNEVKILSKLKHKNIVRYKEAFVHESKLYIAMEFAEQGDLAARIKQRNGQYFEERVILGWFTQLCLALKHIHTQNIVHRDLKTQNIFLGKDDIIKLGDFGIARSLDSTVDHAQTVVGTPYYMSPEICESKPYNYKSDMWSLGCVLYELTTLRHPFVADNFPGLVVKILHGEYDRTPSCYGPLLEDLISVLLRKTPQDRPSAKQLLHVPAMRPYVEMYVSYEHNRAKSEISLVAKSPLQSRNLKHSPKDVLSPHEAKNVCGNVSRCRSGHSVGSRSMAVTKTPDYQRCFSEGRTPLMIRRDVRSPARKSSMHMAKHTDLVPSRCRTKSTTVKESVPQEFPDVFSPRPLGVEIEAFPLEHPAVCELRKVSSRCRRSVGNSRASSDCSNPNLPESKQTTVASQYCRPEYHKAEATTERVLGRNEEKQGKPFEKYRGAFANKENFCVSSCSKQHRRTSSRNTPLKALKPANVVGEPGSNRPRGVSLRGVTYTVISNQHPYTKEVKDRENRKNTTECTARC